MKQGNKRYKTFCRGCDRFQVGGGKKCPICRIQCSVENMPAHAPTHADVGFEIFSLSARIFMMFWERAFPQQHHQFA